MTAYEAFEARRPRLLSLAYRLLGSYTDAEDVVQDAFLRWQQAHDTVAAPEAWLARVVTNLCLDVKKSGRAQREVYVGPWLPEPVATSSGCFGGERVDPEKLSLAFLTILERLTPLERATYVLSHAFDFEADEIAEILGRSGPAVRQLLHRARERVSEGRPRFQASDADHARLLGAFLAACTTGDLEGIKALLARDVVSLGDGGGKAKAALKPIFGADRVARQFAGLVRKVPPGLLGGVREVNGVPSFVGTVEGKPFCVLQIESDGRQIVQVMLIVNPEKLRHLG